MSIHVEFWPFSLWVSVLLLDKWITVTTTQAVWEFWEWWGRHLTWCWHRSRRVVILVYNNNLEGFPKVAYDKTPASVTLSLCHTIAKPPLCNLVKYNFITGERITHRTYPVKPRFTLNLEQLITSRILGLTHQFLRLDHSKCFSAHSLNKAAPKWGWC